MNATKKTARIAGLLYLVIAVTGAFSLLYVPSALIVPDDAAATAARISASELLFRAGIVAGLVCQITFIFLVLTLHRLLKDVDRAYANAMVALVIVAVPIAFLNAVHQMAVLVLLSGADFLSAFNTAQLQSLMMIFLKVHQHGVIAVEIFWGLWLFPFGVLVFKSRILPRALGILLIVACVAYVVHAFTALLFPHHKELVSSITSIPSGLGEFAAMLWLSIMGAKASGATGSRAEGS